MNLRVIPASQDQAGLQSLLVSIQTPVAGSRVPVDVVVVLDISGSMGMEAKIQGDSGAESHGLSLLDVAKHAVRTIANTLQEQDRLSLITFNHLAQKVFELVRMTKAGQRDASDKLGGFSACGGTSIWHGLQAALDMLESCYVSQRMCHRHMLLLTDGESQDKDSIIPRLKKYKRSEANSLPGTINTFGFGYNIDSKLLRLIAEEGMGLYGFIPDAGFVGTVFVNMLSNLLTVFAVQAVLNLDSDGTIEGIRGGLPVESEKRLNVRLGALQFQQSREVIVDVRDASYLDANVSYLDPHGNLIMSEVSSLAAAQPQRFMLHKMRTQFVERVGEALERAEADDLAAAQRIIRELRAVHSPNIDADALEELRTGRTPAAAIKAAQAAQPLLAMRGLLQDIDGQTTEAFAKRCDFVRWGKHYVPALQSAHRLQLCSNFKDNGVQYYGGELFWLMQDQADDIFNALPAPKPSHRTACAPLVSMGTYNDQSAG